MSLIGPLTKKFAIQLTIWKKHAISNYYDSIDTYLDDSSKDNNKLYWKLMKESFNIKLSNEIPQIEINNVNGVNTLANSDIGQNWSFEYILFINFHYWWH